MISSICLLAFAISMVSASCAKTSMFIGAKGDLSEMHHNVKGSVEIIDDCTFRVSAFYFDGDGPAVQWYGGKSSSKADLTVGTFIKDLDPVAVDNVEMDVTLPSGVTFESMGTADKVALSVWCADFSIDFGSVELAATGGISQSDVEACAAWAGASGSLSTLAHQVSGKVTIMGDCSLVVEDFNYDGNGPGAYWVYEAGAGALTHASPKLPPAPEKRRYTDECVDLSLAAGVTWNTLAGDGDSFTIGVYCVPARQLFGSVTLTKPTTPTANAEAASCATSSGCPTRNPNCLANCHQLDSYVNVWWQLDGDEVTIELEAEVDDDTWVGFGPSNENGEMIGADVVITGMFDGQAEAHDYYLSAKSQCNYQSGANSGVCPDAGQSACGGSDTADLGASDVTVVSGQRVGTVQRVRYKRKLSTGDKCDRAFDGATRVVWATGPITPGGAQLVVNVHASGYEAKVAGHSPTSETVLFDATATPGVPSECVASPRREQVVEKKCVAKKLVSGVTEFTATVENYETHPNPPGWGVTWHMNGNETPELVVERGTKYTFKVDSTSLHPFYITDDVEGGRTKMDTETVFAGSADAFTETKGEPVTVEWTPDASTPDMVYYQCWTHIKLGWRIYVVDAGKSAEFAVPDDTATVCPAETGGSGTTSTLAPVVEEDAAAQFALAIASVVVAIVVML